MLTKIKKRDGRIVSFSQDKIITTIFKAAKAVGGDDMSHAEFISKQAVKTLEEEHRATIPTVEEVQDIVECVPILEGKPPGFTLREVRISIQAGNPAVS